MLSEAMLSPDTGHISPSQPCSRFPLTAALVPDLLLPAPLPGAGRPLGYADDRHPFATNSFSCTRAHREVAVAPGIGGVLWHLLGGHTAPSCPTSRGRAAEIALPLKCSLRCLASVEQPLFPRTHLPAWKWKVFSTWRALLS